MCPGTGGASQVQYLVLMLTTRTSSGRLQDHCHLKVGWVCMCVSAEGVCEYMHAHYMCVCVCVCVCV
mgnify:FL=1